ncbi:MAG: exo-alpha-sialidase [Planctomycetales bacterium]|nr:exo-alpha-sialidase [Planctomycetales bacterium]
MFTATSVTARRTARLQFSSEKTRCTRLARLVVLTTLLWHFTTCPYSTVHADDSDGLTAELVFPLHGEHNHAPGIVECPNGDLLISWYRGSGERTADDVAVYGARQTVGQQQWSEPFLLADRRGFPDCNTAMMIDQHDQLWLFWPTILANSWESCLTNYRISTDYLKAGPPVWSEEGLILLKPDDFSPDGLRVLASIVDQFGPLLTQRLNEEVARVKERLGNKLYQRLGWQPRCKPTVLPSGRILLPLYTDTFSISIMAISDDQGETWFASKPLLGFGNIQPAVLRRDDGTLVAYMRDNGPMNRVLVSESGDEGLSWGPVVASELLNPGSGLDGVRLQDGRWVLVYNDTIDGRQSLAISLSNDQGKTWPWTRHLEKHTGGSYHYPAVIQSRDGKVHVVYSYFVEGGKSMKHVSLDPDWITQPIPQTEIER